MDFSTTGGAHTGQDAGGCGGGAEKFGQAGFEAAMSAAEDEACGCEGAEDGEEAGENEGAECAGKAEGGEPMTLAERIDELAMKIAELEKSGKASPEELQALREELMELSGMEGLNEASLERLDGLAERLNALEN